MPKKNILQMIKLLRNMPLTNSKTNNNIHLKEKGQHILSYVLHTQKNRTLYYFSPMLKDHFLYLLVLLVVVKT